MRDGNDQSKKLEKAVRKHRTALTLCALAAAALSWATWPAVLEIVWAVVLAAVPVGTAFLMIGIYSLQTEEKRRKERKYSKRQIEGV